MTNLSPSSKSGIYRGWPIAGVSFLSVGAGIGMAQFAFGVFITPLEEEFGWTRTQINISLALGVVTAFASPFIGRFMDRYGARSVMVLSLGVMAAGFLLRAVMTDLWQFYLFSALIFLGTPGATMMPAARLVGIWFSRTRGRTLGLVTAGNNFGGMVSVPVAAGFIVLAGWRWGFAGIGLILLVLMILAFVIIRDRPEDVEKEAGKRWAPRAEGSGAARAALTGYSTRAALATSAFWFLMIGMTLQQFARTAVSTQLIPHLEQVGMGTGQAASAVSLMAFFAMASKIISGRISEQLTARYTFVAIIAIQIAGLGALAIVDRPAAVWPTLALFGLGIGGVGVLGPLAVTEMFGLRNFGSILGLSRPAQVLPLVGGPLMAGLIFDATGTYQLVFLVTMALLVVSALSLTIARPPRSLSG